MSDAAGTYLWRGGTLQARDDCDVYPSRIVAADSWLVADGAVRAIDLHRQRWFDALGADFADAEPHAFWDASLALLPRAGNWFPRVDARVTRTGPQLLLRLRRAPEPKSSVVLATAAGKDPRTAPTIKGPDLEAMLRLRVDAQTSGADEAVLLTDDGAVAEGSTSCLLWWHGDALCLPEPDIERVDSVTVRSILALAAATGVEVLHDRARPAELEGLEIWAVNALHGIRIVTSWIDGPSVAELPGRRGIWAARIAALRRPLADPVAV